MLVAELENRIRIASRGLRHFSKPRRTPRVLVIPNRVVVVAANNDRRFAHYKFYDRLGFRPVVHQIAQNPQFVIGFPASRKGVKIAVNIGNDYDFHLIERAGSKTSSSTLSALRETYDELWVLGDLVNY